MGRPRIFTPEEIKIRRNAYRQAWRNTHRTQEQAKDRAYREKNAERERARATAYYQTHKPEKRIYARAYYLSNKAQIDAAAKQWQSTHRDNRRVIEQRYIAKHPALIKAKKQKEYARKRGAPIRDLTHQQWLDIQAAQDHRCAYCDKRCKGNLTQDHITPISKGGSHTLHNVIGACKNCNSRKGNRAVLKPIQPLLL